MPIQGVLIIASGTLDNVLREFKFTLDSDATTTVYKLEGTPVTLFLINAVGDDPQELKSSVVKANNFDLNNPMGGIMIIALRPAAIRSMVSKLEERLRSIGYAGALEMFRYLKTDLDIMLAVRGRPDHLHRGMALRWAKKNGVTWR